MGRTLYTMYIYIYIFLSPLCHIGIVYVVKKIGSFQGALSINGCSALRKRTLELKQIAQTGKMILDKVTLMHCN